MVTLNSSTGPSAKATLYVRVGGQPTLSALEGKV